MYLAWDFMVGVAKPPHSAWDFMLDAAKTPHFGWDLMAEVGKPPNFAWYFMHKDAKSPHVVCDYMLGNKIIARTNDIFYAAMSCTQNDRQNKVPWEALEFYACLSIYSGFVGPS